MAVTGESKHFRYRQRELLYAGPGKTTPWGVVPDAKKVSAIIGLAKHSGVHVPGARTLEAIEREVDYDALPLWRRKALETIRAWLNAGKLEGSPRSGDGDRINEELRLAEFLCRVEDMKHFGDADDFGESRRWKQLSEVEKLDRIVRETGHLGLYLDPVQYEVIDREVDVLRVPEGRRKGIESARQMTILGPDEYIRRREAKYAPPNEAAAQFKERIEEKLWTTCYSDGQSIWADWSDLLPEEKVELLRARWIGSGCRRAISGSWSSGRWMSRKFLCRSKRHCRNPRRIGMPSGCQTLSRA